MPENHQHLREKELGPYDVAQGITSFAKNKRLSQEINVFRKEFRLSQKINVFRNVRKRFDGYRLACESGCGLVGVWINKVGDLQSMPSAGLLTSAIQHS
jgi:hypothetical protein